jgi:putative membrane protein
MADVTGDLVAEAQFDSKIAAWARIVICGYLCISVVGILLIPFWWLVSYWYGAEYLRRVSARLTTNAVEIRIGVFFRKESTIPLNRITDVRLHDGPVMRHYGLRGVKVETAGSSGQYSSSEGNLVGVIDAEDFRNAVLEQRQRVIDAETGRAPAAAPAAATTSGDAVLVEIRDILARIETQLARDGDE